LRWLESVSKSRLFGNVADTSLPSLGGCEVSGVSETQIKHRVGRNVAAPCTNSDTKYIFSAITGIETCSFFEIQDTSYPIQSSHYRIYVVRRHSWPHTVVLPSIQFPWRNNRHEQKFAAKRSFDHRISIRLKRFAILLGLWVVEICCFIEPEVFHGFGCSVNEFMWPCNRRTLLLK